MRTSIVVIAVLLGVACSPTPLAAQGNHYTLGPTSYDETGCTGPSPCLCPSLIVGFLTGSFDLVPILPPLGPIFEFNVVGFSAMSIAFDGTITTFDGGGTYTIDLANSVQEMILSVDVNGVPTMFQSIGQVPMALGFPQSLEIGVYAEVAPPCIYDGLYLVAETPISGSFIRGDTNEDGSVDIADAIGILLLIFPPAPIGTPPTVSTPWTRTTMGS